jgi:putative dehydrogenase
MNAVTAVTQFTQLTQHHDDPAATTAEPVKIGMIGLGIMGSEYARHLLQAGYQVCGFDVDAVRLNDFAGNGGVVAESPAAVVHDAAVVIIALSSMEVFRRLMVDPGEVAAAASADQLFIDTGTLPLALKESARDMLAGRAAHMIDATVTGTRIHAERRELVVYASGEANQVERALPILRAFANDVRNVGVFGMGTKLKLITNHLVAIHNAATAEALILAECAGVDPKLAYSLIDSGPARSEVFHYRGATMLGEDFSNPTMRIDVFNKDLSLIDEFARTAAAPTPLFQSVAALYRTALDEGRGAEDAAAVFLTLRGLAGRNT